MTVPLPRPFLFILALISLCGCRESSEFPNPKPGAWEIVSTLSVSTEGAPAEIERHYRERRGMGGETRTSRLCITADPDEVKLREHPPRWPNCEHTIVSQNSVERVVTIKCTSPRAQRAEYTFRFANQDSYIESALSRAEVRSGNQSYTLVIQNRNVANYLGGDCGRYGAKRISELGRASSLLQQLSTENQK